MIPPPTPRSRIQLSICEFKILEYSFPCHNIYARKYADAVPRRPSAKPPHFWGTALHSKEFSGVELEIFTPHNQCSPYRQEPLSTHSKETPPVKGQAQVPIMIIIRWDGLNARCNLFGPDNTLHKTRSIDGFGQYTPQCWQCSAKYLVNNSLGQFIQSWHCEPDSGTLCKAYPPSLSTCPSMSL